MSFSRLKTLLTVVTSAALTISLSSRAGLYVIASEPVISGQDLRTANIRIAPPNPTVNDHVSIKISGRWPNTCIPRDPKVTRSDDKAIRVSTSNPGEICGQALTSWSHTLDIGKLAAGAYKVTINHTSATGQERLGSKQFNVRP